MRASGTTGQLIRRDGQDWWFDAGSVAIDFAYAGGFDETAEAMADPGALAVWLQARFPSLDGSLSDRDFADARQLQQALARLITATATSASLTSEDIDVVNLFAATPDIPPALDGGSRQAGRTRPRVVQALSSIAREAIILFSDVGAGRIRSCEAEDCDLIFFDGSRAANRRWCSMQRCGNRAKVRAHRERAS
jgi:predicted RNA-binding Zn ribbon-like protein